MLRIYKKYGVFVDDTNPFIAPTIAPISYDIYIGDRDVPALSQKWAEGRELSPEEVDPAWTDTEDL